MVIMARSSVLLLCAALAVSHAFPQDASGNCTTDEDCPEDRFCRGKQCEDFCVSCKLPSQCVVRKHVPQCACYRGWVGDPWKKGCNPNRKVLVPLCYGNEDCPEDRICCGHKCVDPCLGQTCPDHSACQVRNHSATCGDLAKDPQCQEKAYQACSRSEDCREDQTCDNNKCVDACLRYCGANSRCEVVSHIPSCGCPPGYDDSHVQFSGCLPLSPVRKKFSIDTRHKVEWSAADAYCLVEKKRLATIESKEENEAILEFIRKSNLKNEHFWTSGTDLTGYEGDKSWFWATTEKDVTFSDWREQPTNGSGHCLAVEDTEDSSGYRWHSRRCSEEHYYICEQYTQALVQQSVKGR